jgi:hypothetical protein
MSELMCGHMDAEASFNGLDDLNREGPLILSAATRRNEQVSILIGLEAGKDVTPIPAQVSSHMVGDLGNELSRRDFISAAGICSSRPPLGPEPTRMRPCP